MAQRFAVYFMTRRGDYRLFNVYDFESWAEEAAASLNNKDAGAMAVVRRYE